MNLMNTLAWWQWTIVLAVPPAVVLLYFLKLKRQPLEVPSTYLWHRTIEDLHVNSIWQRLRQNLLLFLQLLLLLLAIISLLRPYWTGTDTTEDRYIFLIDTSASMSATDVQPNRLEFVKNQLVDFVENKIKSSAAAMVISFSDQAIVEQPYTTDHRLLVRKIKAIQQTERPSMLEEALRVAAGLANPGRTGKVEDEDVAAAQAMPATLMIYTDGRFRAQTKFAMENLQPKYIKVGSPESQNVGIVAFSTAANPDKPDEVQMFAQVENFAPGTVNLTANLLLDGTLIDAAGLKIASGDTGGVEFTVDAVDNGQLTLEIQEKDDLATDNVAYAAMNPPRRAKVLFVSPGNEAYEFVLSTRFASRLADVSLATPDALQKDEYKQQAQSGNFDLIIYDRCIPDEMPQANTYFIGTVPPHSNWKQEADEQFSPLIIDSDFAHPLLQFTSLRDVLILACRSLTFPQGGRMLMDSQFGPLLAIAPREGFEDLVQAFEIITTDENGEKRGNTNWHIRTSFPVFVGNVLSYLGGATNNQESPVIEPGQSIALRSEAPVNQIVVESPTGQKQKIMRSPQGTFLFSNTVTKGTYKVAEGDSGTTTQQFSVNLFDRFESNTVPAEFVSTDYEQIKGTTAEEPTRREAWKYLLIAALLVLILEWYVYNRRVYL